MASKLFKNSGFLRNLKNARINNQTRSSHGHHVSKSEVDIAHHNTIDHLPQPKGSFQELDAKRQSVNNTTLAIGVTLFISALFGTAKLGLWDNVLFSAPKDKISKDFPGAKFVDA